MSACLFLLYLKTFSIGRNISYYMKFYDGSVNVLCRNHERLVGSTAFSLQKSNNDFPSLNRL